MNGFKASTKQIFDNMNDNKLNKVAKRDAKGYFGKANRSLEKLYLNC